MLIAAFDLVFTLTNDCNVNEKVASSCNSEICFFSAQTLELLLDKTKCVSLWNEKKIIVREVLNEDEVCGKERPGLWKVVEGYPSECKYELVEFDMEHQERLGYTRGLQHSQVYTFENRF